jgi:hypothetical protein
MPSWTKGRVALGSSSLAIIGANSLADAFEKIMEILNYPLIITIKDCDHL